MSLLRYDVTTNDWVVFAPERIRRPRRHDAALRHHDDVGDEPRDRAHAVGRCRRERELRGGRRASRRARAGLMPDRVRLAGHDDVVAGGYTCLILHLLCAYAPHWMGVA